MTNNYFFIEKILATCGDFFILMLKKKLMGNMSRRNALQSFNN